jgi:hypothetical protein
VERNSIHDAGSNRGAEVPEQSRPCGTHLVPVLGVGWICLQPQGLVVTTSGARGLVAHPVTEPRVVEERRLSVVGVALVEAECYGRCEFVVEACNAMNDGVGELMHANIAGPRRRTRPVGESDHLLTRK